MFVCVVTSNLLGVIHFVNSLKRFSDVKPKLFAILKLLLKYQDKEEGSENVPVVPVVVRHFRCSSTTVREYIPVL